MMITTIDHVLFAAASGNATWLVIAVTVVAFAAAILAARRPGSAAIAIGSKATRTPVPATRYLRPEPVQVKWLEKALVFILIGYIIFDRPFAWIHVPGTPLFIGEMVIALGAAVILSSSTGFTGIVRSSASLRVLRSFMAWGAVLLALGILPYSFDAIRDSAIWYYGIIAMYVALLLVSDPERVNRWLVGFAKLLPVALIWFPFATILMAAAPTNLQVPDSEVPIFFHRTGNMAVLAAVGVAFLWMADGDSRLFTPRQRVWLTTVATFVIVLTGLQNRGGLVASVALFAALMFLLSKRRVEMVMMMMGVMVLFATIGIVFNVKIQLFDDRAISIEQFSQNITSIFDQDSGGYRQTETIAWRMRIWERVLDDVSSDSPIMGFGMGFDIGEKYGITTSEDTPLRNPHNSHVGVLARMGWLGTILWAMLWITWMAEMQTLRRRLRYRNRPRESAVVGWIMLTPIPILINAIFDPTLEGAQVAMLMWAFFGAGSALVILAQQNRFPSLAMTTWDTSPQARAPAR